MEPRPGRLAFRPDCPACSDRGFTVCCDMPYDDPGIVGYLDRHYRGRLDRSWLEGARYQVVECARCGLLYQRQVPGPELLAHLYHDAAVVDPGDLASRRGLEVRIGYAEQIERAIRHLDSPPHQIRVLDVGAGYGDWLRMAQAFGCSTAAVELDDDRAARLGDQGHEVVDLDELVGRQFDLVNLEQVVEHLVDPVAVLGAVVSTVLPGGLVRIGVPNGAGMAGRLARPDWNAASGASGSLMAVAPLEHLNCFDPAALTMLARRVGLRPFRFPMRTFAHTQVRLRAALGALRHRVRPLGSTTQWFTRV